MVVGSCLAITALGQLKKQFSIENSESCDQIELSLKAKTGNCFIRPSQNQDILNIYSNQDLEEYAHSFSNEVKGKVCMIKLDLQQDNQSGVGHKISYKVLGADAVTADKFWKVYLTDSKPYSLDLDYGLGNANVDLSGLAIKKLKINTGSADVNIAYNSGLENKVEMDTFSVQVDVGSVTVKQLDLTRSKVILADVGFGNLSLDFGTKALQRNRIKGSVGAGNLIISLPDESVPVVVRITDSWLCSIHLCKSLKKVSENTFANAAYVQDPKNAMIFDLDVSMGKILFKDK
ncbi:MAG: hypothetical protein DI538_17980 [Azospira oryzae]|nr:hypothetical protein [Cytophaga sp.]PZR33499.1 MAG: hypothetical protein DI538_17980 [Azospira oryzae]